MVSRIKFSAGGWRGNYAESRYVTGRRKLANFRSRGKGGRRQDWTIFRDGKFEIFNIVIMLFFSWISVVAPAWIVD